ncbi:orotidine-5'-phosphate decarboxylase [Methanobrevibacter sp. OttesenSCG-928-K11]|nr:orotidine-5'-phosphate decarboxylase [Methanobrevibacter sp. OttesenSCG-928-K11]MDL2270758.1 orotidine-5'-phosphate decarboxylase [Methanobrevibacter sp. OttesenSCG-928-I08]
MKIKNNIILALDVVNMYDALDLCSKLKNKINTVKIGYPLTLAEGIESIMTIKENYEFNIICDYKVADIPATNSKICDITFKAGADAIICHGFTGSDSVQACLDSSKKFDKELFLLTEMSHPGAKEFIQKNADEIAEMGKRMDIKNYVAPSTRIDRLSEIRDIVGPDAFIISPGVGTQGGNPKETLKYSDAIIVGRSLYESDDPKKALEDILESIS